MDAAHPRSVQPVSFYSDTITLLSSCSILGIGEYKGSDAAPVSRGLGAAFSCVALRVIALTESWMSRVMRFVFNSKCRNVVFS